MPSSSSWLLLPPPAGGRSVPRMVPTSPVPVMGLQLPTAGGAPASVPPAQGLRASERPSPESRNRRQFSGHHRVNGSHSRAGEKEAGGSQTGEGARRTSFSQHPGSVGRDRSPPTMATAVFVCPEGKTKEAGIREGPSCRGFCLACKTVRAAAFMC